MRHRLLIALAASLPLAGVAQQRVVEWVENAPVSDETRIALGYPVPLPVDTPMPFDGFRSYAGLHTRHQDLAATTNVVHAYEIGQTRAGRAVWAYRLGDADFTTVRGEPEPATLTNGGIHAREWQSPEAVTGIMELIAERAGDGHFYAYLADNVNMVVIPVLNVDGYLQTQREPTLSWLGTDPNSPAGSPRDGRMRRKNMLGTDEDFDSAGDHLLGVDLNRNNPPWWATSFGDSSPDERSLIHHGAAPHSEPETQALAAAAELGPPQRLRAYTDVHSFTRLHLWPRNENDRLAAQQVEVLGLFSDHHLALPGGVWYAFDGLPHAGAIGRGIGSTDEYFLDTYQIPAWTLEIEPTQGQAFFGTPGCGADYGGLARNCHDGFILPESQIRRVRENLAQSFAAVYYRQAGPPSVTQVRVFDEATGALVYDAEWDTAGASGARALYLRQAQPLALERPYRISVVFDKPMRWLEGGEVVPFPGQPGSTLAFESDLEVGGTALTAMVDAAAWPLAGGGAPAGYDRWATDTLTAAFRLPADTPNLKAVTGTAQATLAIDTTDMVGLALDANPATRADWSGGAWAGYEDAGGVEADTGGPDRSLAMEVTREAVADPFVLEPGISGAWFDPDRSGEGFILEWLPEGRAGMYWFTYDDAGEQDWYIAVGEVEGNRVRFDELLRFSGGVFGPSFDPAKVVPEVVGSAEFTWWGCEAGDMDWRIGNRQGRQRLVRLSYLLDLPCGEAPSATPGRAGLSGSWYDPGHAGEGYTVELLSDGRAGAYWFSFGPNGERRWFFGIGEDTGEALVFDAFLTTRGGVFGDAFDPAAVQDLPWGRLELYLGCDSGTATWTSTEEGFPAGRLDLVRLTTLDGLACGD